MKTKENLTVRTEMDQYIASLYDTDATIIEKIAQNAHAYNNLYKLAEQEGIDLSGLTQEQLDDLAADQLAAIDDDGQQEVADPNTVIKEAQANLELADYMGRIMAHAYYQEMGMIEKTAFDAGGVARNIKSVGGEAIRGAGQSVAGGARRAAGAVGDAAGRAGSYLKDKGESAALHGMYALDAAKKHPKTTAAIGAGTLAAGGGAAYAAHKKLANAQQQAQQGQEQGAGNAGAFEQLKIQRAAQILQEQGFDTSLLAQHVEQIEAQQEQEQQQAALMEQAQYQQQLEQQQLAEQQHQQYQQQMQQRQAEAQQQRMQQQVGQQQQNVAPQAMGQVGQQQGAQGAGQYANQTAQRAQAGRSGQLGQQQQGGQQFAQQGVDPQAQQAEAIKMANAMMQQQFEQALDEGAWEMLAQAGYPIQEDQPQQQMQGQQFQQPIQ